MLLMWLITLGLQASASTPQTPTIVEAPAMGPLLWNGLRAGMSAEQAAAVLRNIAGIRAVRVIEKKNKPPRLEIGYSGDGVEVGFGKAKVITLFEADGLSEVQLSIDQCLSVAQASAGEITAALKDKYKSTATERVVDEQGVSIMRRPVFFNSETRVRVWDNPYNPALGEAPMRADGAMGAVSTLGAIFGAIAANEAVKQCPADEGARTVWSINYSSQERFEHEMAVSADKQRARAAKTRDGL